MYKNRRIRIARILRDGWKLHLIILLTVVIATISYQNFLKQYFEVSRTIISVLGTALAFFIGFINNQAYERWWEARKIWGMLTNDSWTLSRMTESFVEKDEEKKGLIHRHLAFLYALIDNLRGLDKKDYAKYLSPDEMKEVENKRNIPSAILNLQGKAINKAQKENQLELFRMVQFNELFTRFSDSMGMAIRINTTVFPPYYKALIGASIWTFIITFPMVLSERIGYWAILYSFILGVIFESVYVTGQVLMDPFENKISDTPISTITRNIEIDLLQGLGEKDIPKPLPPINNEYYL